MKSLPIIIVQLLFISFCACSQSYLNKSRTSIERILGWDKKYIVEKLSTDSTLVYKTNDPRVNNSEFAYKFDKNNKCISEAYTEICDKCYQELLKSTMKTKLSKWTMIDSTRYVYKNMELRTHYEGKPYAFVIRIVQ